jgi:hypothetical protein
MIGVIILTGGNLMKYSKEVGRFHTKSDKGQIYIIIEFQEYEPAPVFGNPNYVHQGLKSWKTVTGQLVNQIDSETYQIFGTDEVVRKF